MRSRTVWFSWCAAGLLVASAAAAPACGSNYGASTDDSDAAATDSAGPDGGPAADACARTCTPGTCGDDGCGGTCACGAGEGCVDAKCFPCTGTWRTGNLAHKLAIDAKRNYVFTSLNVDGGAAFATLNACTGDVIAARTPAKSNILYDPVPQINELVSIGDRIYTRGACGPGAPSAVCFYRYDTVSNTVDAVGQLELGDAGDDVWGLSGVTSGKLFASGSYGPQKTARIIPMTADLASCGGAAVPAGTRGGTIGTNGDDVYQAAYTSTADQLLLVHYIGASCATASPCGCAPADVSPTLTLPIANPTPNPSTYSLLVRDGMVYVFGVQRLTMGALNGVGFVAAFDVKANAWLPPYLYTPNAGAKLDALLQAGATPDGKLLYVVGTKAAFEPAATGVLLRFDLPFAAGKAPTPNGEISVPGMTVVWDVNVTADAVFLAGEDNQIAKCTLALACKP
jgi:hypothetical protein